MSPYDPNWSNANASGRVDATNFIRRVDLDEIAAAINRRLLLVLQSPFHYAPLLDARPYVSQYVIDDVRVGGHPPDYLNNFREAIDFDVLLAMPGGDIAYYPNNPIAMDWLWPLADGDENKTIVQWTGSPSATEVGLFNRLNGVYGWTDPTIDAGYVTQHARAVHLNELRQALEWLRRGRWVLPCYGWWGLVNTMPDQAWFAWQVGNNGSDDIRTMFGPRLHIDSGDGLLRGLHGVKPISASMTMTFSQSCTLEFRQILRPILHGYAGQSSWDFYNNATKSPWAAGGATGPGDSQVFVNSISATANVPLTIDITNTTGWLTMWQSMLDGDTPPYFLARRLDTGATMVNISNVTITLDFELNSPPA